MPIQLGGPSLPKPKKPKPPKVLDPFGVPHVGAQTLPGLGGAQPIGVATPQITIPSASGIVGAAPAAQSQSPTDPYGDELRADEMYGIGQKNYQDALDMGRRTMLSDPINRLIQTYGYDPRTTAGIPANIAAIANQYFDPTGLDAARKGGYTTAQQIERSFGQALAGVPTDLGMSGLQHSGSSAIIGNRLNYERGLQDKTAIDQLLSGIGTANQNWTDFQTNQANIWRQAQEDIATRLAARQGYHGEEGAVPPQDQDYSGGPASIFQPAPDVQALMDRGQASGQWDSWAKAMGQNINAANKPQTPTQKTIAKVKAKAQPSPWAAKLKMMEGY